MLVRSHHPIRSGQTAEHCDNSPQGSCLVSFLMQCGCVRRSSSRSGYKASEAEDQKRDLEVVVLRNELNHQREEMVAQEEKLIIQDSEIKSLRKTLLNVMSRLGME